MSCSHHCCTLLRVLPAQPTRASSEVAAAAQEDLGNRIEPPTARTQCAECYRLTRIRRKSKA